MTLDIAINNVADTKKVNIKLYSLIPSYTNSLIAYKETAKI